MATVLLNGSFCVEVSSLSHMNYIAYCRIVLLICPSLGYPEDSLLNFKNCMEYLFPQHNL